MLMTEDTREIRVNVADYAVASAGTISTIGLGSCVAIVLYDSVARVGGLAHVLLPSESLSRDRSNPAKFPSTAVPLLLERDARPRRRRGRMQAKIVGGASMFGNLCRRTASTSASATSRPCATCSRGAKLPIVAQDTGSDYGRSVYFYVRDGRVEVKSLRKGSRVL